jgi:hypothetical protein
MPLDRSTLLRPVAANSTVRVQFPQRLVHLVDPRPRNDRLGRRSFNLSTQSYREHVSGAGEQHRPSRELQDGARRCHDLASGQDSFSSQVGKDARAFTSKYHSSITSLPCLCTFTADQKGI